MLGKLVCTILNQKLRKLKIITGKAKSLTDIDDDSLQTDHGAGIASGKHGLSVEGEGEKVNLWNQKNTYSIPATLFCKSAYINY
jgi:hypothetical protein